MSSRSPSSEGTDRKLIVFKMYIIVVPSDLKAVTGSCGRTRAAGCTTASGRRSKRQRAGTNWCPYTVMTSGTGVGRHETRSTDSGDRGKMEGTDAVVHFAPQKVVSWLKRRAYLYYVADISQIALSKVRIW